MTLISDGGSTKCDWILLNSEGKIVLKTRTRGINPAVVSEDELIVRLEENEDLKKIDKKVQLVDLYGAGCGTGRGFARLKLGEID